MPSRELSTTSEPTTTPALEPAAVGDDEVSDVLVQASEEFTPALEIEKSRAVQEVQAQLIIAHRFPRNEVTAETRIITACCRGELATVALFRYKRGGQQIEGETIRLAEVMAQAWGNLDYGFDELHREKGRSFVSAHCWDLETNVRATRRFWVEHALQLKDGKMKHLSDPRDIYEKIANEAQRRVRACILEMVPVDVRNKAKSRIKKTALDVVKAKPIIDQVKEAVVAFLPLGVSEKNLLDWFKVPFENVTAEQVVELKQVYQSLTQKMGKREDYFDIESIRQDGGRAGQLNAMMKGNENVSGGSSEKAD